MALSPENRSAIDAVCKIGRIQTIGGECYVGTWSLLSALLDAARAQGRASLEERVRLLEGALKPFAKVAEEMIADKLGIPDDRPLLNAGRNVLLARNLYEAAALLATPGERENG